MTARPLLKWAGGKGALLQEILPRLPEKIATYYEPFVGGGAVFFGLSAENRFKRAVIGDTNGELLHTYSALAWKTDEVIMELKKHFHDEKHFYEVRAKDVLTLTLPQRAARLIYLNRTCYNGLYRVNSKGLFNTPFGKYVNPTICDEENLRAAAIALRDSICVTLDFKHVVASAKHGDAVYFDPPYTPVSETANFTAYTVGGFTWNDQVRLRDCMKDLDGRGVHVLLSNADVESVRELYQGFRIEEVKAPRRVNSKGGKRGKVGELLISGRNGA